MVGAEQAYRTPQSIGMSCPNAARMYGFFLGGAHNFEADRRATLAVPAATPQVRNAAWANRQFLRGAVQYALDQGIRQFLDLGSGIPTVGNVHEIVHTVHPGGRVLYIDADPVVVRHAPDPRRAEHAALLPVTRWRPDPGANESPPDAADSPFIARFLAGVGRKQQPATNATANTAGSAASNSGAAPLSATTSASTAEQAPAWACQQPDARTGP